MSFFSGPPKDVLLQVSQGVASIAMQLQALSGLEEKVREHMAQNMRAEDGPTTMDGLIVMAAGVIREQNMGWYKKNLFLGMIFGNLVSLGMSAPDANYIKNRINSLS